MGQLFEYIKIAFKSIISNKGRTFLTMLGIIIGISAVIMISGLGSGVKNAVNGEMGSMFAGQTYIYCSGDEYITLDDIEYLRENIPGFDICTMEESVYGEAYSIKGDFRLTATSVNETYENYDTNGKGMLHGRYFTEDEVKNGSLVCVIGEADAQKFFGSTDVVGQEMMVSIYDEEATVRIIGVRNATSSALMGMMNGVNKDSIKIEIPYSAVNRIFGFDYFGDYFWDILIRSDNAADSKDDIQKAINILEARHDVRGKDEFVIDSFDTYMETINKVIGYITAFIAFVSMISLLVGGIGVMNIMLVSVTERTQEIGIRKALGARTGSIMVQFLAEAAMITFVGGLLGVLIGYGGAEALCLIVSAIAKISVNISINPVIVLVATLFSVAIGIGFGIIPARKAAKLSPIEALRQE